MAQWQSDKEKKDAASMIFGFFEAGKSQDLPALGSFHSTEGSFTKSNENPPDIRQSSEESFVYQATFANISDYTCQIDDLRIDLFGDTVVYTFYLAYKGMLVNGYSFEGSPVSSRARVTMILAKIKDGWKIAHEHLSPSRMEDTSAGHVKPSWMWARSDLDARPTGVFGFPYEPVALTELPVF